MRVLVTGGAGYIGSVIVEELQRAGHVPVVYDSLAKGHQTALDADVPLIQADVRDTERLAQTLREHAIDAVIHMAALIVAPESVAEPLRYFENNVGGSMSVLHAMRAADVRRIVFSSTASLYGETDRVPTPEDEPTVPTNPYGETKSMVEQMLRWVAEAEGITATSLRYFNAAGATERNGEVHDPETHLIPLVLRAASEGRPVRIFGTDYPTPDGTGVRDYIHVVDLAQAHLLALGRTKPGLRVYNVGNGNGYSVRQVIETAREVTGLTIPAEEHPRRPGDQAASVASSDRIRAELGWQARYPALRDILATAWRWLQAHPGGYHTEAGSGVQRGEREER